MYKMIFFIALSTSISLSMIAADSFKGANDTSIFGAPLVISPIWRDSFSESVCRALCCAKRRYIDLERLLLNSPQIDIGEKCLFTSYFTWIPDASPLTVAALLGDEKAAKIIMWFLGNKKKQAGQEALKELESFEQSDNQDAAQRVESMKRILRGEVDADDEFVQSLAKRCELEQEKKEIYRRLQQEINAAYEEYGQDETKN